MHRFGRSSDQRWRDRWGGGFVVVTVLALAGAWYLGNYLSNRLAPDGRETMEPAVNDPMYPVANGENSFGGNVTAGSADLAGFPKPMTVYYLQAHALASEEKSASAVRDLNTSGLPAVVSHTDGMYRVIIGAYGSKDAATQAKMSAESNYKGKGKLTVYTRPPVTIAAEPSIQPANAKVAPAYHQGVAALSGYLHAVSSWWDATATGHAQVADNLSIYTNQLRTAIEQLQGQESDAAVNQFINMANKAVANSNLVSALANNAGATPAAAQGNGAPIRPNSDQVQAALEGYVALLDSYRNWTAPALQP